MKKPIFTTSEYVDHLELSPLQRNVYLCKGKEFALFSIKETADQDAQWWVDYWAKQEKMFKKPEIYRIRLERVK